MSTLELVYVGAGTAIPEAGTILDGKYRVDGPLGKGGMAVVLAATHLQLEQRVAIKLLLPEFAEDPQLAARFMKEGRAATKIRSEHVVRVLDVGDGAGHPYLVMEYLDGTDLDVLVAQSGPLPTELAVDYLLQACEAIAEAHVLGIVHRDLKPANLFLTHRADGSTCVKVLDFGISKTIVQSKAGVVAPETSPLLLMGSPHYMSPEQMQSSRDVDARSDLWSLGAILHELVAGKPPFHGGTITALCAAIMVEEPPVLTSLHGEVPPELAAVVRRCLEKDPAHRFENVAFLAAALAPLGSEAAGESAICIARVLEASPNTIYATSPPPPKLASDPPPKLASDPPPEMDPMERRPRGGIGRRLGGIVTLLALGSAIGWVFLKNDRAILRDLSWPTATAMAAPLPVPVPVPVPVQLPRVAPWTAPVALPPIAPAAIATPQAALIAPRSPPHEEPSPVTPVQSPLPAIPMLREPPRRNPLIAPAPESETDLPPTAVSEGGAGADNPY